MKKIKVPTLLVQGQRDTLFNLQEAVATFKALRAQGTPARMVWQSWGHSHSTPAPGELDFDASSLRSSYLGNRFLDWMNHYVRGSSKAPVGPRFSYFRDWVAPTARTPAQHREGLQRAQLVQRRPDGVLVLQQRQHAEEDEAEHRRDGAVRQRRSAAPTSYSETSGLEGGQVNNGTERHPGHRRLVHDPDRSRTR